jgi:hypothetical protein
MTSSYNFRDRMLGSYFGSAAGDALGGPVEGWHAHMIRNIHTRVDHFLPYTAKLHPGYALVADPGAITDDTFIKDDFAQFVFTYPNSADRTPENLVKFMLKHAHFEHWWPPAVNVLKKIESEGISFEESSHILMGGGAAWWTPFGLINAGNAQAAYDETSKLSLIWRLPFEQNLIAAVQAGVAASVMEGATVDTLINTVLEFCGPLARKLLLRAKRIAETHEGNMDRFIDAFYFEALVEECSGAIDGPMPKRAVITNPYRGATVLWAEQIPLAFAALVFGKGDFLNTMVACINLGRDCDSTGSTCGSWIGGLTGLKGIPEDWVSKLQYVNRNHMDIHATANKLADMAGAK